MNLFEAIEKRRSIRKFSAVPFEDAKIERALEAAVLAPNSSNTQTWDFHWVQNAPMKQKLVAYCMNQAAARTASQLIVVTADPKRWKRSHAPLVRFAHEVNAPKMVKAYYEKLIPLVYRWGFLQCLVPFKFAYLFIKGCLQPIERGPISRRDLQEVAIKSAALACENFVLAIEAQGGATCMMEGFDGWRLKRLLKLPCSARIVMVIAAGYEGERATWGPRFRIPTSEVVHRYR